MLNDWENQQKHFIKVMPTDYKKHYKDYQKKNK